MTPIVTDYKMFGCDWLFDGSKWKQNNTTTNFESQTHTCVDMSMDNNSFSDPISIAAGKFLQMIPQNSGY